MTRLARGGRGGERGHGPGLGGAGVDAPRRGAPRSAGGEANLEANAWNRLGLGVETKKVYTGTPLLLHTGYCFSWGSTGV